MNVWILTHQPGYSAQGPWTSRVLGVWVPDIYYDDRYPDLPRDRAPARALAYGRSHAEIADGKVDPTSWKIVHRPARGQDPGEYFVARHDATRDQLRLELFEVQS